VKIARVAQGLDAGYDIGLSVQAVLNCGKDLAGTCDGGHPAGLYQWVMNNNGVVYDTCQLYEALDTHSCSDYNTCRDCIGFGYCWAVPEGKGEDPKGKGYWTDGIPRVTISEHGFVSQEKPIMKEILLHGPVACGIDAVPLLTYTKGIQMAEDHDRAIDHVISIVGWGEEDGVKYWEVRNSWGEFWGEFGWARVERGVDALGIERECFWATPESWGMAHRDGTGDQQGHGATEHYDDQVATQFWKKVQRLSSAVDSIVRSDSSHMGLALAGQETKQVLTNTGNQASTAAEPGSSAAAAGAGGPVEERRENLQFEATASPTGGTSGLTTAGISLVVTTAAFVLGVQFGRQRRGDGGGSGWHYQAVV